MPRASALARNPAIHSSNGIASVFVLAFALARARALAPLGTISAAALLARDDRQARRVIAAARCGLISLAPQKATPEKAVSQVRAPQRACADQSSPARCRRLARAHIRWSQGADNPGSERGSERVRACEQGVNDRVQRNRCGPPAYALSGEPAALCGCERDSRLRIRAIGSIQARRSRAIPVQFAIPGRRARAQPNYQDRSRSARASSRSLRSSSNVRPGIGARGGGPLPGLDAGVNRPSRAACAKNSRSDVLPGAVG